MNGMNLLAQSLNGPNPAQSFMQGRAIRNDREDRKVEEQERNRLAEERKQQEQQKLRQTMSNISHAISTNEDPQQREQMHQRFISGLPPEMQQDFKPQFDPADHMMFQAGTVDPKGAIEFRREMQMQQQKTKDSEGLEKSRSGNQMNYLNTANKLNTERDEALHQNRLGAQSQQSDLNVKYENLKQRNEIATKGFEGTKTSSRAKLVKEKEIVEAIAQIIPGGVDDEGNVVRSNPSVRKASIAALNMVKTGKANSILEAVQMVAEERETKERRNKGYLPGQSSGERAGPRRPSQQQQTQKQKAPKQALDYLNANPQMAGAFKAKYGYLP